jgi:hypothetical protein
MARKLSRAFDAYVLDKGRAVDIVGIIAYSLHKADKNEWVKSWYSKFSTLPTDTECFRWSEEQSTPTHVQAKRRIAEDIVQNLIQEDRDREYAKMKEAALKDCLSEISGRIPHDLDSRLPKIDRRETRVLYGFLGVIGGISQNVLGTIAFVVLAGLFIVGKDFPSYIDFGRIRQFVRDEPSSNTKPAGEAKPSTPITHPKN